jgi:hypothetical protein
VFGYFLYGAIDRLGLESRSTLGRVTGKHFTPGSTTYNTNIVAGRAWTQAERNPDNYLVNLDIEGEPTGGLVTKEIYEAVNVNEQVHVRIRRTRLSKRLLVTDVTR